MNPTGVNAMNVAPVITLSGLSGYASGSLITLTVWGIGDNQGQQSSFSATYDGATQTAETLYNNQPAGNRLSTTGSIPYVQFQFTKTGTDDDLALTFAPATNVPVGAVASSTFRAINGFSLSVVPEPGAAWLAVLTLVGGHFWRRRR